MHKKVIARDKKKLIKLGKHLDKIKHSRPKEYERKEKKLAKIDHCLTQLVKR